MLSSRVAKHGFYFDVFFFLFFNLITFQFPELSRDQISTLRTAVAPELFNFPMLSTEFVDVQGETLPETDAE